MNIICYDSDGQLLKTLYQWDSNQTMKVTGIGDDVPVFHFCNKFSEEALVVAPEATEDGVIVKIPNILLQQAETIIAYMYFDTMEDGYRTIHTIRIPVIPRPRPDDYEYVENIDYISVEMLSARLSAILKALTEQETSDVSLEVIDIRTGYDGTEYDTAGDAVRAIGALAGKTADVVFEPVDSDVETTIRTGHYVSKAGVDTQSMIYNCTGRIAVSEGDVLTMTGTSLGVVGAVGINYVCAYRADGVVNEDAGYGTTSAPLSRYTVPSGVAEVVLSYKATFSNVSVIRTRKELALARRDEVDAVVNLTSEWEESGVSPTVFLLSHAVSERNGSAMILDDENVKYVAKFNSTGGEGGVVHTSIYKYDNSRVDIEFYRDDDEKIGSVSSTVGEEPWSIDFPSAAEKINNAITEIDVSSDAEESGDDPAEYLAGLEPGRYKIAMWDCEWHAQVVKAGEMRYAVVDSFLDDGYFQKIIFVNGEIVNRIEGYLGQREPALIELEDVANVAANGMIEKDVTSGYIAYASDPSSDYPAYLSTLDDGRYRIKTDMMTITAEKTTVAGYRKYLHVRKALDDGYTYDETYIDGELYQSVEASLEGNDTIIRPWKVVEDIEALENKNTVLENKIKEQAQRIKDLEAAAEGTLYRVELDNDEAYSKTVPAKAIDGKVNSIGGKSVVLNQIFISTRGTVTNKGVTSTPVDQYSFTLDGTASGSEYITMNGTSYTVGHVYLCRCNTLSNVRWNGKRYESAETIITVTSITAPTFAPSFDAGDVFDASVIHKPECIDLTQMFGAGHEPTTVEQAYEMGVPRGYIPYNAGEIVSADVSDVVVSGTGIDPIPHPVPQAIRALPGYGWSAGSVYNEVDYANKQYIQRVQRVLMPELPWVLTPSGTVHTAPFSAFSQPPKSVSNAIKANLLTSVFVTSKGDAVSGSDGKVAIVNSATVRIGTADLNTIADQYLYYELATPIITDISDILLYDEYWIDGATEGRTVTFEQSGGMMLPVPNEVSYKIKLDGISTLEARLKSGSIDDADLHLGFYIDEDGDLCQKEE